MKEKHSMLNNIDAPIADIRARIEANRREPKPEIQELQHVSTIEEIQQKERIDRAKRNSIINDRYSEKQFDTLQYTPENENAIGHAYIISNNPKQGASFYGPIGTGKTHIAATIAYSAMQHGHTVVMDSVNALLSRLRSTYDSESSTTEWSLMNRIATAKVLVFDDLGKERLTAWSCATLWELVNARRGHNLPLIITTNCNKEELIARFLRPVSGVDPYTLPSLLDRILEMADPWIEIGGKSWRTKKMYPRMLY